jgi:DNA-binding transcriptional ArsR family regulator
VQESKRSGRSPKACCGGLEDLLSPKLFKALSDPRRLTLLIRLAEAGEACTIGSVADGAGVDLSVVSRHLAILRDAGIIECEKQGKEVWCAVQTHALAKVLRELASALEACWPGGCRVRAGEEVTTPKRPQPSTTRRR